MDDRTRGTKGDLCGAGDLGKIVCGQVAEDETHKILYFAIACRFLKTYVVYYIRALVFGSNSVCAKLDTQ
jgi:hypothetical protein